MNLLVLKIGKPSADAYGDLVGQYVKRLSVFVKIDVEIVAARAGQEKSSQQLLERLDRIPSGYVIGLDEHGRSYSSLKFAELLKRCQADRLIKTVIFIVGGPYGLADDVKSRCDELWSLSAGVLPSDLAWLVATEQIYRAYSINAGTPYHHA